jgi:glucosamine--fructose-6-phosphate aminotransferase (isomerizing)
MCGIIAVVRRQPTREPIAAAALIERLDAVAPLLVAERTDRAQRLHAAAELIAAVDTDLRGVPGVLTLLDDPAGTERIAARVAALTESAAVIEADLDDPHHPVEPGDLEATNAALIACKDGLWAIARDRLRAAAGIGVLTEDVPSPAGVGVLFSLHQALSALDRLEVRGRDSAGLEVQLWGHDLDLSSPVVARLIEERRDPSFTGGAVRADGDVLVVVHKAAAEIGELGDNTASLRAAIRDDQLLQLALESPGVEGVVLGHTRWASIGIISEPNAHPQSSDELESIGAPLVTAVLNGDVDNHADLVASDGLQLAPEITTDAKVIPTLTSRGLLDGRDVRTAFRDTVARLEGSVAIGATSVSEPDRVLLALRGSGQALYVGLAEDAFIVASEPYGVVEETAEFLRMDGETPSDPDNPTGSRGQIVELRVDGAGTVEGIGRWSYDGTELPVADADLAVAQITTRDIDRGAAPHYLLKEISDSPASFRKTLRGKLIEADDGTFGVVLGSDTVPADVVSGLRSGRIQRIVVIGQGTAAVAGQSLAHHLSELLSETPVRVEALPATELSGFRMRSDMSDTLAVAISQSGTTTDTNRTVDLIRGRGASVIAIVNRRNSDLTDKSDGVLYTSDGRDVEMSVASTKAFYSQVAAGLLLGYALAEHVDGARTCAEPGEQALLQSLSEIPSVLERTLATRDSIAAAAQSLAPSRRYWAIVGNGVNQIAARELRIKLSELCYKSIACDATEDKKHIDLSSEPLIFVCAAGLVGSTADDVAKEVAIFRAHKAAPIVVASESDRAFTSALAVLTVPETHPRLGFVPATMVGHLFGYEAALAIDAQARPLREARSVIDETVAALAEPDASRSVNELLDDVQEQIVPPASAYFDALRSGALNGHLEAGTAVRLAGLFRYATGISPLDGYQLEYGKVGTPGVVLDDLSAGLTAAIEELTRPVDAIKHQAKTVTVGISRSDESLLEVPLVSATLAAGSPRDRLTYSTLRSLGELDPAVVEVLGATRYAVEGGADPDRATLVVLDRTGVSAGLPSRVDRDPRLRGTKALVAREQELLVARGRSDGRLVVIIPETKDGITTGLMLLHVQLADTLPASTTRAVLQGYRRRYQALKDAVTETEDVFRDDLLAQQPLADLLTESILSLADRWRT